MRLLSVGFLSIARKNSADSAVVDTTVWIDFLEAGDTPFDLHL
jgi:hypothetical protein